MKKIPNEILKINPENINLKDETFTKKLIIKLLGVIESQQQTIEELKQEVQNLKNGINRLKGEQGKPKIRPKVPEKDNDVRPKPKPRKRTKKAKKCNIKIDRTERISVNKDRLPPDAEYKGYRSVVKQNIIITSDNVEYQLDRYYSPSEKKTYEAELPEHLRGSEFDSNLKAHVVDLYFAGRVSEPKITKMLNDKTIQISEGQISNIITKDHQEELTKEKEDILEAGLKAAEYIHLDDTGARHKGKNTYFQVICNAIFSVFIMTSRKTKDEIRKMLGLKDGESLKKIIISDDAKQFWNIAVLHALCWIHEIRHYRKLNPHIEHHRTKLHDFLNDLWKYYERLKKYSENPTEKEKQALEKVFDRLFSKKTGYDELDKRIELTRGKKKRLLLVLKHPNVKLHNNPAEIALRELVMKRKMSGGTRSEDGRIAWENMMSILDTCRKLNVNFYDYLNDIYSNRRNMPRLADLILQQ